MPKERWLHNIEHGAIIMLYDPCVLQSEVEKLRNIVRSCIKKHVITPTTFLSPEKVNSLFDSFLVKNVSVANLSNFCYAKISPIKI